MLRSSLALCALALLAACDGGLSGTTDAGPSDSTTADGSTADSAVADGDLPDTGVADGAPVDGAPADGSVADAAPPVPAQSCVYMSDSFGTAMRELDVTAGSSERLRFDVQGVPDPSLIEAATLEFTSYDADHPGEEGSVYINGGPALDLPAMLAWDNADGTGSMAIGDQLVAGDNVIEFGAGPLSRSFFRIGSVRVIAEARVVECTVAPPPPPPDAVVRSMHFSLATYTNRRTWVIPCAPGTPGYNALRNYAFTASSDEHDTTDCDGGYIPGGDRRGTALFRFDAVVAARYRVVIRSRHTENRNPAHALVIVDGVERRIDQTTGSDYEDDIWGERMLSGTVDVLLDSSRETGSDSITEVRLEPI